MKYKVGDFIKYKYHEKIIYGTIKKIGITLNIIKTDNNQFPFVSYNSILGHATIEYMKLKKDKTK